MSSRMPYLQKTKSKTEGREAYLRRIASIHDDALGETSTAESNDRPGSRRLWGSTSARDLLEKLRSMLRTFLKWFMRLTLVGLVIALLAVIVWYLWGSWAQPSNAPAVVELASTVTAKEAHRAAEPIAQKWADDARIVSLSATWDAGQPFQDGQGDWSLLFYSPTKAATTLISVNDGAAAMVATHGVGRPISVSAESGWLIDSPVAIEKLRAEGGDDFLRSQPEATVSMSLDFSQDAAWSVRLIDQMTRRVFVARVSIDSGEVIDIQQSG